jgi:hypothetical protein
VTPRITISVPFDHLFLVLAKLLLEAVHHRIHRTHQAVRLVMRHKIVLVFRGNLEIDSR